MNTRKSFSVRKIFCKHSGRYSEVYSGDSYSNNRKYSCNYASKNKPRYKVFLSYIFNKSRKIFKSSIFVFIFILQGCENEEVLFEKQLEDLVKNYRWRDASRVINRGLNMNPNYTQLHLLNGFIYERLAESEPAYSGLSLVAYKKSLSIDPNNVKVLIALGRHYSMNHNYSKSMDLFSRVIMQDEYNIEALYGLANASYALRYISVSKNAIDRLLNFDSSERVCRLAALIYASYGDKKCYEFIRKFSEKTSNKEDVSYLYGRAEEWLELNSKLKNINYAKIQREESRKKEIKKDHPIDNFVVECIVLSFSENSRFSRGNNILEALQNFGDEETKGLGMRVSNGNLLNRHVNKGYANVDGKWILDENNTTKSITKGFSIGFEDIRYNLNIANSSSSLVDIMARPLIQITRNGRGHFYSGDKVFVSAGGDVGSALSSIPTGIKIDIQSRDVNKDSIFLNVKVDLSKNSFKNSAGSANDRANVMTATMESDITAKIGKTYAIGGLYSHISEYGNTGIPGLKSVPMVDLFSAKKSSLDDKKSVVILLTIKDPKEKAQGRSVDLSGTIGMLRKSRRFLFKGIHPKSDLILMSHQMYQRNDIKEMNVDFMENDINYILRSLNN
ncbi:hypothetical protein [Candidatus Nesciobacter abundans]|uniref:hypothetical protein n=1 Tax=Candidatus Nesciobacter abundans TaxID=2601668 RepID=UPI0016537D9B|nr:hypothetical protein [Candidatus Nesciobacter abundans]